MKTRMHSESSKDIKTKKIPLTISQFCGDYDNHLVIISEFPSVQEKSRDKRNCKFKYSMKMKIHTEKTIFFEKIS